VSLAQTEFDALLADDSKNISGDISWSEDEDHSLTVEFRVEVASNAGYPLSVRGSYNRVAGTLSYSLIDRRFGRIYGLDLGKDHHNPTCDRVGERHKHTWTEDHREKYAYVPSDIACGVEDAVGVWGQFCQEAHIVHEGKLHVPPPTQEDLL
jgi:hypothetical protein